MRRAVAVLFALALAAAFGWTTAQLMDRAQADRESVADRADLRRHVEAVESANAVLAEQVRALGDEPAAEVDGTDAQRIVVPLAGPRGIPGVTGPAGRNGRDSTVPGPPGADSTVPGPPGKDSEVPGPSGPAGKDGKDGKDSTVPGPAGPAGRGISSVACLDSGDWQFTFADGTAQTVSGPCKVGIVPPSTDPAD